MIAFTHQGTTVTPGQALDVWLSYERADTLAGNIHLFADAVMGFSSPREIVGKAGIEITWS